MSLFSQLSICAKGKPTARAAQNAFLSNIKQWCVTWAPDEVLRRLQGEQSTVKMLMHQSSQYSGAFRPAVKREYFPSLNVWCLIHGGGNFYAKLCEVWKVRASGCSPLKWSDRWRLPHNPQEFFTLVWESMFCKEPDPLLVHQFGL